MSSLAPTKRERPVNTLPSRTGLGAWFGPLLNSSVGSKILVALTGIVLTGFVIVHMLGNLQVFAGSAALNTYAQMLKHNPAVLWGARGFLLLILLLHMYKALSLKQRSMAARPVAYSYQNTARASLASRTMVITGGIILVFLIFHIAHYTLGIVHTANGTNYLKLEDPADPTRHDVYRMVISGFTTPWISVLYLLAQVPLFMHLRHGVGSLFQTLGLNTPRSNGAVQAISWVVALAVCGGNVLIVLGVWAGAVH